MRWDYPPLDFNPVFSGIIITVIIIIIIIIIIIVITTFILYKEIGISKPYLQY